MIRLSRPTDAPPYLKKPEVEALRGEVRSFYDRREKSRRQERPNFPLFPDAIYGELMGDLLELSHGKCAYCEQPIVGTPEAGLDRFRPKAGAVGLDGPYSSEHYWWLAYEWENLYPSCAACNKAKGPKFPVDGPRVAIRAPTSVLTTERRLLVDPFADDPKRHLDFNDVGEAVPLTSAGDVTIATLALNRPPLVAERAKLAAGLLAELGHIRVTSAIAEQLVASGRGELRSPTLPAAQATLSSRPYSAQARAVIHRWLTQGKGRASKAQATAAPPDEGPDGAATVSKARRRHVAKKAQRLRALTIHRIQICNFRGIRELDLEVVDDGAAEWPWLMLLGENATGKSSILQAVALTMIDGDKDRKLGITPKEVLRQGQRAGWVNVWLGETTMPRRMEFQRGRRRFQRSGPPFSKVLLGYGATRLLPKMAERSLSGPTRLENMFDPFRPLLNANRWLGRLDPKSFDYAARALKDVLGLPRSARLRRHKRAGEPGVTLKLYGVDLSLNQLSDGYQSVLGLTCDLMSSLRITERGALDAAEGLVAIDELGAHLHPRWRMRIVASLRKAFPRVQFLVSTHDPLCLRGIKDREVVVLRRTSKGRIFSIPDLPPIRGLRVDQLLTSEFFGLDSTMDPTIEGKYRELYRLLALRAPKPKQEERIGALREELKPFDLPGATRRERRLLEAIDKDLAREEIEPDPVQRRRMKGESEQRLAADLNRLMSRAQAAP